MAAIFDPERLHGMARDALGLPLDGAFDTITAALAAAYPGHVYTGPRRWIFNNAGGAMGQIAILHASLTEYVLFFGTPIGTAGHSGRYGCEVWDFMLAGEMWCHVEGETTRRVYRPGDAAYLGRGIAKGYRVPGEAWMFEYGRGPIPTMLPFGLADAALSTLDVRSVVRTVWQYSRMTTRELLRGKI